jgi:hypothetical protein
MKIHCYPRTELLYVYSVTFTEAKEYLVPFVRILKQLG